MTDCQVMADWVSEWASDQCSYTHIVRTCRGEKRDVMAASGDYWLHNGWRGRGVGARGRSGGLGWDGLGWGPSGAERRPQGTLTQKAIDMEALCGLNCCPLAARAGRQKENKRARRTVHPSMVWLLPAPSPHSANPLHSALHLVLVLTTVTSLKWMLLHFLWCKTLNIYNDFVLAWPIAHFLFST